MRNGGLEVEPSRRDIIQETDTRLSFELPGVIGRNGHSKGSLIARNLERDFQGGRIPRSRPVE